MLLIQSSAMISWITLSAQKKCESVYKFSESSFSLFSLTAFESEFITNAAHSDICNDTVNYITITKKKSESVYKFLFIFVISFWITFYYKCSSFSHLSNFINSMTNTKKLVSQSTRLLSQVTIYFCY